MRPRAAVMFSWLVAKLATTLSKRFCTEPRFERAEVTSSIAASRFEIVMSASPTVAIEAAAPVMAAAMPVPAVMSRSATVMRSVASVSAPIWKAMSVAAEFSRLLPLNLVPSSTRLTSVASAVYSSFRLARSLVSLVELADWTASSRMRCRDSPTLPREPSAVWAREIASLALREATVMPRTCEVMRSAIARPAESSLAELIRRPVDRRFIEVESEPSVDCRARWALSEAMLVLMVVGIATPVMSDADELGAAPGT